MNDTDEEIETGNKTQTGVVNQVYFIKDEKNPDAADRDKSQEDIDSELDDVDISAQADGNQSPAEIKLKAKKALLEFRCKVEDSIRGNYLLGEPDRKMSPVDKAIATEELREITLWGIPLLPSKANEGTDWVLLKFLKAKDLNVADAFYMLQRTMIWRKENRIEGILEEEFDSEYGNSMYVNSRDREGRPVCYNIYGVFKNKELYKKAFGTEERRNNYLRWRIQFMEKAIKNLNFREGAADSLVQIIDLNNAPKNGIRELNSASKTIMSLFQSYYPEIIWKNVGLIKPIIHKHLLSLKSNRD